MRPLHTIAAALSLTAVSLLCAGVSAPCAAQESSNRPLGLREALTPKVATTTASRSFGTCEDGELFGGVALSSQAPGIKLLRLVRERSTMFATATTVAFIERTAARLRADSKQGTVPLRVGNLSLQRGGRMRWSHSHRSGRDVDLAFFAIGQRSGKARAPDRFLYFNEAGIAAWRSHRYRFDTPRNWRLVKTLLTDSSVHIARIYVAEPLRRMMLDYARELGDAEWLLQRASHAMSEPSHAGKHNDHMHVRIYCAKDEVLSGCVDEAPPWPWVPDYSRARRSRIELLVGQLGSASREARMAAVSGLAPLHRQDREATDALVWVAAHDDSLTLRKRALTILAAGGSNWSFPALSAAAARNRVTWRTFELLKTAIQTAGRQDAALLLGLLDRDRNVYRDRLSVRHFSVLRRLVAQRVRPWLLEESARPMMRVLDDPSATTRRAAKRTLEHLANRRFDDVSQTRAWYTRAAHFGRLHWMYEGFFAAAIPVEAPPHILGPRLIDMLRGPDEVLARNAEALLSRVTGGVTLRYVRTPPRRHRAWLRWWDLHHDRFEWRRGQFVAPQRRVTQTRPPST